MDLHSVQTRVVGTVILINLQLCKSRATGFFRLWADLEILPPTISQWIVRKLLMAIPIVHHWLKVITIATQCHYHDLWCTVWIPTQFGGRMLNCQATDIDVIPQFHDDIALSVGILSQRDTVSGPQCWSNCRLIVIPSDPKLQNALYAMDRREGHDLGVVMDIHRVIHSVIGEYIGRVQISVRHLTHFHVVDGSMQIIDFRSFGHIH